MAVPPFDLRHEQPQRLPPPQHLFIFALVLFSVACRLILIQFKPLVGTDEVIYLALGRNLWHGLGLTLLDRPITMCPPLLPLVAGIFSRFTDDLELGTNIVYVLFGGMLVLPYFLLARRLYGNEVGKRASLLLAFYPGLLLSFYWGSMTEPLYTFVLITGLFFCYRGLEESRALDFCLSGFFLGLVYLCRSEGILFFPAVVLYFIFTLRKASNPVRTGPSETTDLQGTRPAPAILPSIPGAPRKAVSPEQQMAVLQRSTRGILRGLLLLTLCFVLISAPYPLFLKKHSDSLSISGKTKLVLLAGAMPLEQREKLMGRLAADGERFMDYAELVKDKSVLGMILENPGVLLGGSVFQLWRFVATLFSWKVFPLLLLPFLLLGLLQGPWDRTRLCKESFLAAACLPFLVFLTFRIWPRYLLPLTPILLLWTARGWVGLEKWIRDNPDMLRFMPHFARRWACILPSAILILPLVTILVAKPLKAELKSQYPVEYKEAGYWMKAHLPAEALILARKPEIAYYAGRMMHPLPNEDLDRVLHYARARGIRYLVVDEYFIATRPQLRGLLADEPFPGDLLLLHQVTGPNGRRVRIFQIRDATPGGAGQAAGKEG